MRFTAYIAVNPNNEFWGHTEPHGEPGAISVRWRLEPRGSPSLSTEAVRTRHFGLEGQNDRP
jgi:hypothetical protein